MESRRSIYYRGNSIKNHKTDQKEKNQIKIIGSGNHIKIDEKDLPKFESKVFATLRCVWCGHELEDYKIICPYCTNCQYCGLTGDCSDICRLCGNQLPLELKKEKRRFVI